MYVLQRHGGVSGTISEYSRPVPPQAQREKDGEQLTKSRRTKSPKELNALNGKNPGNKYPDLTLLPPLDLLPWLFYPEARVHKEASDVVYAFSQGRGERVDGERCWIWRDSWRTGAQARKVVCG